MILSQGEELKVPISQLKGAQTQADPTQPSHRRNAGDHRCFEGCHRSDFGRGGAAEWLGLKRTTLQNKMKRLGIEKKKDYALIDTNGLWQLPPQQPTVAA